MYLDKRIKNLRLSYWFFIPYSLHNFDAGTGVCEAVTGAFDDVFVAHGMQVGEAFGEFYFFAVDSNGAKSCFFSFFGL